MTLLEREHCLKDLAAWHGSIAERGGCIVLIGGEAGIGKTSLLQAFAKARAAGGSRVLWGACDALYTPQPLAPLYDMASQSSGALKAAVDAGASREVLFRAALEELNRPGSIAIFEDMHWADEATLDLLKYLGRRIQRSAALIAVTFRDDEVGPQHPLRFVIGDLPRGSTQRLTLAPLSEPAVEELARQAGRAPQDIYRITGGNPLFVSEVLAPTSGSHAVPVTVRDAVLTRALRLSARARDIAEFVAVIPGKTERWLLAAVDRLDEAALDECLVVGMVRHEEGSFAFRHELVRRALEGSLSPSRQRHLHAQVLDILSRRPQTPAARLAHHAEGSGNAAEVLRLAPIAAAQAAAVGAHREAASHWQAALRHADALALEARGRLHEQLSYECYLIDEIERAAAERRAALAIWRTTGERAREGDALRWLSRLSWFAGRSAEAGDYAEAAIETLEGIAAGAELAMAYSNRAQLGMLAFDTNSAIQWAGRAIEIAQALGDREILSHALNNLGTARYSAGDEAGWSDLTRSLELALEGGYQEHVARAYTNLSAQAVLSRQYDRAAHYLAKGLAYCQDNDLDAWRVYMLAWSARAKVETCEWLAAAEDAADVLRQPKAAPVSRICALTALGHLRVRRGDPDAGSPLAEAAALAAPTGELQRLGPLAVARAEARWLSDDRQGAAEELKAAYDLAGRRQAPWVTGELAVWLWRCDALQTVPAGVAEPYALEMSGHWREAARAWGSMSCPYEQALILGWYGGESEQREALATLGALGAAPAVEALRRRMRSLGVRGVPRGVRKSTGEHPFGLTRREAQILALMCDGLRNAAIARRIFLSPRTVDHHVSAILAKLDVSSRTEAIELARGAASSSG